ncbi:MAG: Fe-S cluster assembly protein SufD [Alphaproteobacteria bacterium]
MIDFSTYQTLFEKQGKHLLGAALPWLNQCRAEALSTTIEIDREAWKYTNFDFLPAQFSTRQGGSTQTCGAPSIDPSLQNLTETQLVFIDGVFQPARSTKQEDLPKGLTLLPLSEALEDETHAAQIQKTLTTDKNWQASPLAMLNRGFFSEGVFLHLEKNTLLEKSILISQFTTRACPTNHLQTLNIIQIDAGAHATLIEEYQGKAALLHNHVNLVQTGRNAGLHFYKIQEESLETNHIHTSFITMADHSSFHGFTMDIGGNYIRNEAHGDLNGERICCDLRGMQLGENKQIFDSFFPVIHQKPLSCSSQLYKSVLSGQARNIFYGKIKIPLGAHGSSAHQLNKNLLLSERAQAFTRPELEILENDINCSHGATVGQLDDKALYYLMTRGLDKKTATGFLIEGFLDEMIEPIQNGAIREALYKIVRAWLQRNSLYTSDSEKKTCCGRHGNKKTCQERGSKNDL